MNPDSTLAATQTCPKDGVHLCPPMRQRCRARSVVLLTAAVAIAPTVLAQQTSPPTPGAARLQWYENHLQMIDASHFKGPRWQFLGPLNTSGRMTDVDVVTPRGDNYTIYVAGASGGVWRTRNDGITWEPIFEHAPTTSIGDVTLAPSDQSIVWVGTGEGNIFRSSMSGAGVWKSTDGGDTWEHKGLTDTNTIPRIVVHPKDPDIVYVAASGNEWTPNPERGVYKSTDGGDSWGKTLYVNERTSAIDLVMDPRDPDTLFAATWERTRKKWNDPRNEAGFSGSGVWKTTDGGANWRPVNNGLPDAERRGRIGIDVARSNPEVIYAFIDNYEVARMPDEDETDAYGRPRAPVIKGASVWRSDDRGESWRQTSEENDYMQGLGGTYGWVFGQIRVDPTNEDRIYVMGLALNVSDDAGKSFRRLRGMHGDHHGLWIDPDNPDFLANVNDGGVAVSYDGGDNWRTFYDNAPLVQFFNVSLDMDDPFRAYGSIQDHGSRRGVVDLSRGRNSIPALEWEDAPGGEGSSHAIDPTDPSVVYSAGFYGRISRTHNPRTPEQEVFQIVPQAEEGEPPLRGQWIAPFIISPHNPRVIYHGMNMLFRSMDRGDSWERISDDLSYNELEKIGDIPYQTIYSISESPLQFGLLYVGTDDGRVWATEGTDPGGWGEITGELPQGKVIAELVASKWDLATVYAAQNGKRDDDATPYLWKSTDYGQTWQDIGTGIPSGPINVVREDPKNPDVLYVGTDVSAYVTVDGGATWHALSSGLPSTFVHDMKIHPRDDILVAATHGRGMWALDVRPIQQLTQEVQAKALHLFDVESVTMPRGGGGFGGFFGVGRPTASIAYWLAEPGDVELTISNSNGELVKTLEGTGDAGLNVVSWDLSNTDPPQQRFGRQIPSYVRPGTYTINASTDDATAEESITISR